LVDTGKKYGIKINIDKSQIRRVCRSNGSVLTRDGYCTRKILMRIATAKEALNRKILLLTCKLNIELKKKLVMYYVWYIALFGSETWTLRKLK
jgi:hypothetical protein